MKYNRDDSGAIIIRDENDVELHPYLTVLYAIETQQRLIPPVIPELTTQGWEMVVKALNDAIAHVGDGSDVETDLMPKTPEPKTVEDVPPPMTVAPRKPQKPVYKAG